MTSSNECISSSVYLVDYFIYYPLLCGKEGQEDRKILYYYPSDRELDHQIRSVGYCEGLVQFTEFISSRTFAFDDACESVHFQKTRLLFNKVENDICLAMTLHIPVIERKNDEKMIMEYHDEHINDRLMLPILKMSYRYFVLQYGTMSRIIQHKGVEELRNLLKQHFDKFIQHHLHTMIRNVIIDSSYFGIQFLAVGKELYLKIQSFLRRFESRFSSLKETLFMYGSQLIWSGFNQDDTSLIYSFFRLYYWPHLKKLLAASTIRYLTVDTSAIPADELILSSDLTSQTFQEFFLGNPSIPYRILVIYSNLITIFCFFHHDEDLHNNTKISSIIEWLTKELDTMTLSFEEFSRKTYPTTDSTIRYVYFNKMNKAHSSTIDWNRELDNNTAGLMNSLAEDVQWFHPTGGITIKSENEPWIMAKRSGMRELLLVAVNQKNVNLKGISDKIKQIFSTQFSNILLLE